jgi:hypothetical protein
MTASDYFLSLLLQSEDWNAYPARVRLQDRWGRVAVGLAIGLATLLPFQTALGQHTAQPNQAGQPVQPGQPIQPGQPPGSVARLEVRVTSPPAARIVSGVLVALDGAGQSLPDLDPGDLRITLDGQPANIALVPGRPTIALTTAFLLDSSASP